MSKCSGLLGGSRIIRRQASSAARRTLLFLAHPLKRRHADRRLVARCQRSRRTYGESSSAEASGCRTSVLVAYWFGRHVLLPDEFPMSETATLPPGQPEPKWVPLRSQQRRVLGVLIEKAKTTPDAYPLTLNALVTGSNQKSNRAPQMNMNVDEVQQAIDELRELGAVVEVQGSGRVPKYRHQMYDWLGVDKVELAVMAELLLRGEQTVGELRARAARMEPIAGLPELKPILQSLIAKNLVLSLTPEGRGQMVCHNLYKERELAEIKAYLASYTPPPEVEDAAPVARSSGATAARSGVSQDRFDELQEEVAQLRAEVAALREVVAKLEPLLS